MSPALVEAATFARRLARRRVVRTTLALSAGVLIWGVLVSPVASARSALAAAQGLGALTTLVLASGCIADDRSAGRLAVCATHPVPRRAWVVGRWLAVAGGAGLVTVVSAPAMALAGPGLGSPRFALAVAAAVAHVAAMAALAVALSCAAGGTAQVLVLLGVLVVGFVPPEVAAAGGAEWVAQLSRGLWTVLPTPWALDRVQGWVLALEAPAPLIAVALFAQPAPWLAAGARALHRAELADLAG